VHEVDKVRDEQVHAAVEELGATGKDDGTVSEQSDLYLILNLNKNHYATV